MKPKSYRGSFRNAARLMYSFSRRSRRKDGVIRRWAAWVHANIVAKLDERREQCDQARVVFQITNLKNGIAAARTALRDFWRAALRGPSATGRRVVYRILRDLGVDKRPAFA